MVGLVVFLSAHNVYNLFGPPPAAFLEVFGLASPVEVLRRGGPRSKYVPPLDANPYFSAASIMATRACSVVQTVLARNRKFVTAAAYPSMSGV